MRTMMMMKIGMISNFSLVELIPINDLLQVSDYTRVHLVIFRHQVDRFYCVAVEITRHCRASNVALLWVVLVQVVTRFDFVVSLMPFMGLVVFFHYLFHLSLRLFSLCFDPVTRFSRLGRVYLDR